ncbi:hypothetical protein [Serinicoccus sp. CNJ-927]|uniref:hypothetical protein n=1 Tax=Serinicoccus sp. CNJ-927 TaxID=1904970 RepID=UPI001EDBB7CF|nr:hypothetical protein [Serinicoccus sp. CNJ-927]
MSTTTAGTNPRERAARSARRWRFLALTIISLVWLFPLVWMTLTALSPPGSLVGGGLPDLGELGLTTVREAVANYPVTTWAVNSLAIAVVAVVLTVVVDLLAGYVLAKRRFPGRAVVLMAIVATLMIPVQVLLIPQFELVAQLGWVNSYWAVIIPRSAEPSASSSRGSTSRLSRTSCSRQHGWTARTSGRSSPGSSSRWPGRWWRCSSS